MPYSSGTYTAPTSSWNPAVANTAIDVTAWTALLADFTTAFSSCLLKDGSQTSTGLVPFAQSLSTASFVRFAATKSASAGANDLDDYQENNAATLTATGMTTSPTGTLEYTIIGDTVIANIPAISGTSNSTSFTLTGLPAEATPAAGKACVAIVQDNGAAAVAGLCEIGSSGVITFGATLNTTTTSFTASGTKGCRQCMVCWKLT